MKNDRHTKLRNAPAPDLYKHDRMAPRSYSPFFAFRANAAGVMPL